MTRRRRAEAVSAARPTPVDGAAETTSTATSWLGVRLVADAPLRWTASGVLVAIEPGDVFEVDEGDLAVPGVDPAFWLRVGAARLASDSPDDAHEAEDALALADEAGLPFGPAGGEGESYEAEECDGGGVAVAPSPGGGGGGVAVAPSPGGGGG